MSFSQSVHTPTGRLMAGLVLLAVMAIAGQPTRAGQVQLLLQETATVTSQKVRVGDICRISSADAGEVSRISNMVVAEFLDVSQPRIVNARYLRIRTALSGIPLADVRVLGANQVEVKFVPPTIVTDADIQAAARDAVRASLGVSDDELQVHLVSPFVQGLPEKIRSRSGLKIQVLPPSRNPIGRLSLQVRLWDLNTLLTTRNANVHVQRRFDIAVPRVSLARGQKITDSDVVFESRFLDFEVDSLQEDQVIGQTVRAAKPAGTILSSKDLQETSQLPLPVVVRPRDPVRATVKVGNLRVVLRSAEALQQGRVGDRIEIKNMDSGEVRSGVVTAAGEVAIRL